ncbi:MAG: hypothetical protein KAU90_01335, partial [Sulfurovaceae bacterium]|nr:hypothetical protein [Sulfurovaceae bacterium]
GKGYYVDDAVKGVDFKCGTQKGVTDENGTFTFENGQNCVFKFAGLKLREINASSLEDNVSVLEDNVTVAQLLQTLDKDGNASNGIQLVPNSGRIVRDKLSSLDTPLDKDLLEAIHDAIKAELPNDYNGRVVDKNQTKAHLDETRDRLSREGRRTQHDIEAGHRGAGSFGDNNGTMQNQGGGTTGQQEFSSEHNRTMLNQEDREARQQGSMSENNGTIQTQGEGHTRQQSFMSENNETVQTQGEGHTRQQESSDNNNGNASSSAEGDNEHVNGSGSGSARGGLPR